MTANAAIMKKTLRKRISIVLSHFWLAIKHYFSKLKILLNPFNFISSA